MICSCMALQSCQTVTTSGFSLLAMPATKDGLVHCNGNVLTCGNPVAHQLNVTHSPLAFYDFRTETISWQGISPFNTATITKLHSPCRIAAQLPPRFPGLPPPGALQQVLRTPRAGAAEQAW